MEHPKDHDIQKDLLPNRNGVVHVITDASQENDSGEYECTVTVKLDAYSAPLQSDKVFNNLIIYGEFAQDYIFS